MNGENRLCQKLGLGGYTEFRVRFAAEVVRDLAEGRAQDKSITNLQYLQAMCAPASHVAFIISRTGENRQLIEMAEHLNKQKNRIILLTSVEKSTLAGLADVSINVASADSFSKLGSLVFLVGAKYIMEVLFATLMAHHYEKALTMNDVYEHMFRI
ncbi:MAG: SIS domain-containing protein [Selenomonas sp.]|nr:SIS domain-containing protein [Selenomonas sp.]